MEATHVANPVQVRAEQIRRIRVQHNRDRGVDEFWADLDGPKSCLIDEGMLARYRPVPGDYIVTQDDGYMYVNPRDVFERKYLPLGQRAMFVQDRECAAFLHRIAEMIEVSGEENELVAVVAGTYGGKMRVYSANTGIETIGLLSLGRKIMEETVAPNPATSEKP